MLASAMSRRRAVALLAAGGTSLFVPLRMVQAQDAAQASDPANILDELAWRLLATDPEQATALGIDTGANAGLRFKLKDRSANGIAQVAKILREDLRAAESIPDHALDPAIATSLAVVSSAYTTALEGLDLPYGDVAVGGWRNAPYVVIQNVGAYLDAPRFLDADHPIADTDDAEAYLARLAEVGGQLDGELERMLAAEAAGLIPPGFLLDKTLAQMRSSIAEAREGGPYISSITRRTGTIPGEWERRARTIVNGSIVPALERQLEVLAALRGKARSDPGMLSRPHGEQYYAWALRAATTTALTPNEIHELGQEELAELHGRMEPILRSLGYTQGTVGARMGALLRDPRFMFAQGDDGRTEILAEIARRIDWIKARMPRAFRRLVSGNIEVRRLPPAEEPGAPAAYGGPGSIDGSVPGRMWINLRTTDLHRRYDLPTLVHHETIPGHVWQGEYANQLPLIRSVLSFNAYSEGWALYGEQLADELGAYEGDPAGQLGYLQSLAFRACRMVVDTGLHAHGWSREQAIEFFVTRNGNKREEVESEVDRYCSWPGQACGYKLGHSEIVRQRDRAREALGDGYDLRDFNQAVVDGGNVPLDVLADNISRFIERSRA